VPATPYIPGVQGAGVVVSSSTLPPGTNVWFQTSAGMKPENGSMAELATVPERDLLALPVGVQAATAAALGLSSVAAWSALTRKAQVKPGETVLVLGAGGTVGQVAVQAARILGAGRIVAAARSHESRAQAERYGADATVDLSGTDDPAILTKALQEACDGFADVVIDPVFGIAATAALGALGDNGRFVQLGGAAHPRATFDSATIRGRSLAILGYTNNSLDSAQTHDTLLTVLGHASKGQIEIGFDVVPLRDVADAWQRQAAGSNTRRIVLVR
jgi:NADPH:quinone reductase